MKPIKFIFESFAIGQETPPYFGFTKGEEWNGWDVVYVTAETLEQLRADLKPENVALIPEGEEPQDDAIYIHPIEHEGQTLYRLDGAAVMVEPAKED